MKPLLFCIAVSAILLPIVASDVACAQDHEQLKDENRAVLFLDVDVKRIRDNEFVKQIGFEFLADKLDLDTFGPEFEINDVDRVVFAAFCDDYNEFISYGWNSDLPYSFYVQITFGNSESMGELREGIGELPHEIIDGKKYLRPPEGANVNNWLAFVGDKELLIGSEDYILHGSQGFLTERLRKQIEQLPEDRIIKMGVDCLAGRPFLEVAIEAENFIPPEVRMFAMPLLKLESLSLAADLDVENVLKLQAEAANAADAEEVEKALGQQLNMGKVMISILSTQLETDAGKATFKEILDQLKPTRDANVVSINIDQPEGFVDLLTDVGTTLRAEAMRVQRVNKLRQLALAALNYESAYSRFPFNTKAGGSENADLSWRARILPYIEEHPTWNKLSVSHGWDHETNLAMADKMPKIYGSDGSNAKYAWIKSDVNGFADITDGSSNTIMLIEIPEGRPWLKPNDLSMLEVIRMVKGLEDGEDLAAVRYDGSTTVITNELTHNQLKAIFTPAGGEASNR